jgi:glycerol-3-phosphate dehydrogenase
MEAFLDNLNDAFPTLGLDREEVLHVYSGLLPAEQEGSTTLAKTDRWIDHGERGGPKGLFSVQGMKFTAARSTAERGMAHIFPDRAVSEENAKEFRRYRTKQSHPRGVFDYQWKPSPDDSTWREELAQIVRQESVVHLDDLILRRTSLGDNPARALQVAPTLCEIFDWTEARCREEIKRVEEHYSRVSSSSPVDERV